MIEYDVTINGMAVKRLVSKYGYETGLEPVEGQAVTTLDTVDHLAVVRWRNTALLQFNPMDLDTLGDLMTAIKIRTPVEVKLYSLQLHEYVKCRMRCEAVSNRPTLLTSGKKIVEGFQITLTEL